MYLNIVNGNKMYFIKYLLTVIIIKIPLNGVNSDIPTCNFYNTRNISDLGANYTITDQSLVSDYDYIQLKNGTRISVETHKRYCVCPEPCINFCNQNTVDIYTKYPHMNLSFTFDIAKSDGSYDYDKDLVKYFNYTVRKPCTGYLLKNTLNPGNKYDIYEDGSLYLVYSDSFKKSSLYCWQLDTDNINDTDYMILSPYLCPKEASFYHYLQLCEIMVSVMFLLLTIIFYYRTKRTQSCHGKCFIMYLINLTIQYSLISFVELAKFDFGDITCIGIGYIIHFMMIGFLTWTCIISYHTFISLCNIQEPKAFRQYLAWGLLVPIPLTLLIYYVPSLKVINRKVNRDIEPKMCDIGRGLAFNWYYLILNTIVLVFNLILYIKVIRQLKNYERCVVNLKAKAKSTQKKRFFLYFRLFVFMGVIWFVEVLLFYIGLSLNADVFALIIYLFNCFHGLYIFLIFVVKPIQKKAKADTAN